MKNNQPALLLIHGLGATKGVWAGVEAELDWPGPVIVPDLPGHGVSSWADDYSIDSLATLVALACDPQDREFIVVGHSLGGAVGVALASDSFGLTVQGVIGLGIKVTWTDEDVVGMAKVAAKGIRWFETRQAAEERFLLQSGLAGIHPDDRSVAASLAGAVAEGAGGWRVAQDPATFAQGGLDMAALIARAVRPVVLGAGSVDAMVTEAELAVYVDKPVMAAGKGHNAHVEDPAWVAGLIKGISE